jgi:hypothetical protein
MYIPLLKLQLLICLPLLTIKEILDKINIYLKDNFNNIINFNKEKEIIYKEYNFTTSSSKNKLNSYKTNTSFISFTLERKKLSTLVNIKL